MSRFTDVIGQEQITAHLQKSLQDGRISHAYILDGPEGIGKRMLADIFAQTLLCSSPEKDSSGLPEPCEKCDSCIQAQTGNNPDIIHVTHEKEKTFRVDEVRAVRDDIVIRPVGAYKVYILEDAHLMNPQAQNALLKTLEEPPSYAVLMLLADGTQNFLPTILSRAVTLRLKQVPDAAVAAWLEENCGISHTRALAAAGLSGGRPGHAAALAADENFEADRRQILDALTGLASSDAAGIAETAALLSGRKELTAAGALRLWLRDISVRKAAAGTKAPEPVFPDYAEATAAAASALTYEDLGKITDALNEYDRRVRVNIKEETALDLLLLSARDTMRREKG
ncbi:MAG: DNA polymerase III subunit [Lachnospiraceae bacterium]|nr:DNA polymerase III subunit [Lachnospiraceae bacterium]